MSLKEVMSQLVANSCFGPHKELYGYCSLNPTRPWDVPVVTSEEQSVMAQENESSDQFDMLLESFHFSSWLSNCLEKLKEVDPFFSDLRNCADKFPFVEKVAEHFLERSICILPQNRGLQAKEDKVSLDVKKVERLLIQSRLRYLCLNFSVDILVSSVTQSICPEKS